MINNFEWNENIKFLLIFFISMVVGFFSVFIRPPIPRKYRKHVTQHFFEVFADCEFKHGKRFAAHAKKALFKRCPICNQRVYFWLQFLAALFWKFDVTIYYCLEDDEFFLKKDFDEYKKSKYIDS